MKFSGCIILTLASVVMASCPLGYPPENACSAENPSCALFIDENGDTLCDNPGPQPDSGSDQQEVEDTPADSSEAVPDTLLLTSEDEIPVPVDSTPLTEIESPDDQVIEEPVEYTDPSPPVEEEVYTGNRVTILSDAEGDLFCINPERERGASLSYTAWDIAERFTDSSTITEEVQIEVSRDSVSVDTVTIEEVSTTFTECPLGYSPEDACSEDSPSCTLFSDANGDSFCDNPGKTTDSTSTVNVNVTGRTYSLVPLAGGCPIGLPSEAACPSVEGSLCPNYRGWNGCTNPSGGGMIRTRIILIATAVLLIVATILKRRMRGRTKEDRRKRKIAHISVQILSLAVLGFLVQGCFCPLGVIQYALLPGGLIFLGGLGIAILILPIIWSAFFGRIYCGWVCPFGALQDLLGKLHVPRPPKFPHRIHHILSGIRYLLAVMFFGLIILASSGQYESFTSAAFFCRYDPFHTIFSFFIIGSFTGAIVAMSILVFFPRFFCKYLCFYGAILSFMSRIELWKRFAHKHHPDEVNQRNDRQPTP